MGKVVLNQAVINSLGSHPPVDRDMRRRAHRVQTAGQLIAPRITGHYAGAIHVDRLPKAGYRVTAGADYAKYVEWDTRPHIIRPRVKKALFWPGAAHPVAIVRHPGTTGQHIMARALKQAEGRTHT